MSTRTTTRGVVDSHGSCSCFSSWLLQCRDVLSLSLYVMLLLPGFLSMAWWYSVHSNRISVQYKHDSCRQTVDIYGSSSLEQRNDDNKQDQQVPRRRGNYGGRPVILFLPGGAFMIGYKMWASLFAQAMMTAATTNTTGHERRQQQAKEGMLIIAADYRNYPFGTVPDMIQDVDHVIGWTLQHCAKYGGDPTKVVVIGQSAGAHLAAMALLLRSMSSKVKHSNSKHSNKFESKHDIAGSKWEARDLKGFIGLSGVYDLSKVTDFFHRHGISPDFVESSLFGGRMDSCSPMTFLQQQRQRQCSSDQLLLPPFEIWHGGADKTIQHQQAKDFVTYLGNVLHNGDANFKYYPTWTHTDAIIESLFEGDHTFHYDVIRCIEEWCQVQLDFQIPSNFPSCPTFLVQCARKMSPF